MPTEHGLSDHCMVDHKEANSAGEEKHPLTPLWIIREAFYMIDRVMHFNGVRGTIWRTLGVDRSSKNPNICNI